MEFDQNANVVVIKNKSTETDKYIYEPLFGEFAAFRLKGLITCSDAVVVIVGYPPFWLSFI